MCFPFWWALPGIAAKVGRKVTHAVCLLDGAAGLLSAGIIHPPMLLLLSMVGVGIAWASTVSMAYAILSSALPQVANRHVHGHFQFLHRHSGDHHGVGFGWVMEHFLHDNSLAALLVVRVKTPPYPSRRRRGKVGGYGAGHLAKADSALPRAASAGVAGVSVA